MNAPGATSKMHPRVASPPAPYSIQNAPPEPQVCPKFVPTIVFGVPIRGTRICEKFVEKLKKFVEKLKNDNFPTNFQFFDKF